jgi:hypothetical protein
MTKVYRTDKAEMFEALKRLGASTADVLFSRGTIFVEGAHDAELLNEGFFDLVSGYKVTELGGREEVEKSITNLQAAEARSEVDKINVLIFDLDNAPSGKKSSKFVRIIQWDRYCFENYLLDEKILFDIIVAQSRQVPASRGTFLNDLKELALAQLNDTVITRVYRRVEPDNPGMRPSEISGKDFSGAGEILVQRLLEIRNQTTPIASEEWIKCFVSTCEAERATLMDEWSSDWKKKCNGKRLIQDLYKRYEIRIDPLTLKKRIIRQMQSETTEDWRVVESTVRNELK